MQQRHQDPDDGGFPAAEEAGVAAVDPDQADEEQSGGQPLGGDAEIGQRAIGPAVPEELAVEQHQTRAMPNPSMPMPRTVRPEKRGDYGSPSPEREELV